MTIVINDCLWASNGDDAGTFQIWGERFDSVDQAYLYARLLSDEDRQDLLEFDGDAREFEPSGRKASLSDEEKINLMTIVQRAKFLCNDYLAQELVETGNEKLINSSTSEFWGVGKTGNGLNWLGKILELVREDLQHVSYFFASDEEEEESEDDFYDDEFDCDLCSGCGEKLSSLEVALLESDLDGELSNKLLDLVETLKESSQISDQMIDNLTNLEIRKSAKDSRDLILGKLEEIEEIADNS